MADTVEITLSNSGWIDISSGSLTGLVTNNSNRTIIVIEAAVVPGAGTIVGHPIFSGPDGFYNYVGITGTLYARALPGAPAPIIVAVTRA